MFTHSPCIDGQTVFSIPGSLAGPENDKPKEWNWTFKSENKEQPLCVFFVPLTKIDFCMLIKIILLAEILEKPDMDKITNEINFIFILFLNFQELTFF